MGFFTGAYLKIMTGKMKRQLQNRLVQVTMQMNRVTKQIGDMEKQLQNQENSMKNAVRYNTSIFMVQQMNKMGMGSGLEAIFGSAVGQADADAAAKMKSMSDAERMQYQQMAYQQAQSMAQQQSAMNQEYITQMMDMYREAQLEPLKNMEDSLATEKATLETRIQTLTDQEKAAQEMEKQGAKDMAPDYTGQGQG